MGASHRLFLFLSLARLICTFGSASNCVRIVPDSNNHIPVEIGQEFTATCNLQNNSNFNAGDIVWISGSVELPRKYYTRVNESAVRLTVNITSDMHYLLKCKASSKGSYSDPCYYGIFLSKGYRPEKPENLSCMAVQSGPMSISPIMKCRWDPGTKDPIIETTYTLFVMVSGFSSVLDKKTLENNTGEIDIKVYPLHMEVEIWVEVNNSFEKVSSDKLKKYSEHFVKTSPPSSINITSEANFSKSLMVHWKHPIAKEALELKYNIRFCKVGSNVWSEVPQNDTQSYTESFRLQSLQPHTEYVVQMRCIHNAGYGYWSNWSPNATAWTTEAKPSSKPDLWRIITSSGDKRRVRLVWKAPVQSNGIIQGYDMDIHKDGVLERLQFSTASRLDFELSRWKSVLIEVTANNSAGISPKASLAIPKFDQELPSVKRVGWSVRDGKLWVEWLPRSGIPQPSEYVLQWVSISDPEWLDWQREPSLVRSAALRGNLEPFKRYNISVYPVYRRFNTSVKVGQPGKPNTIAAYLQEGAPLKEPKLKVKKSMKNGAELGWDEIPLEYQRGFITNYTIFYKTGDTENSITVGPQEQSHTLNKLVSDCKYVVHIMASTVEGSINGSDFTFNTLKYAPGEIEGIVVTVCIGFLFITVLTVAVCLANKETCSLHLPTPLRGIHTEQRIKKRIWPQVPDPSNSTIANWSPDFPTRADTPKEATLADLSMVEVDVFEKQSLCEEDKVALPLKKDKYLSEEHSSGIGGSSCMSSPRQSVSDSDEGGDSGQTTASTVQYSSVVASGYKGQTPGTQTPAFARSESTQPLLDCEEHGEHQQPQESSGQGPPRHSYFRRAKGPGSAGGLVVEIEEQNSSTLAFCPTKEGSQQTTPTAEGLLPEGPTGPEPCYRPQQSGYRPQ